ncbi:MAG: hypothetical protein US70_C0008G0002 [Parcubacteria group bacterium GW2011_GWD2_38_11]|nr:MAG: hypothetical protein US70_C0008G0002 [Parcubacteria group bacterium GW2011_GWD2_38_11]
MKTGIQALSFFNMLEEYLDIVDEKGNLTGEKELRSVCHEKGLWHQTVHIYFYRNNDGVIELLPHLRSKYKSSHPNRWDTRFGGHVETGQSMNEAAEREVKEETGIKIEINDLLRGLKRVYDGGANKEVTQVYYYNFDDDLGRLTFDDGEVQEVRWMNFDEIEKEIIKNPEKWSGSVKGLQLIKKDLLQKNPQ